MASAEKGKLNETDNDKAVNKNVKRKNADNKHENKAKTGKIKEAVTGKVAEKSKAEKEKQKLEKEKQKLESQKEK